MKRLKKLGRKLLLVFMAFILLAPLLANGSSDTAYAAGGKRGSHTGMVYLRVLLDVSLPGVSGMAVMKT